MFMLLIEQRKKLRSKTERLPRRDSDYAPEAEYEGF
jgi:hypothetical protein